MIHGDRVQETTTTTGTGDLTLGGATTDHLSFSAEIGEGETVAYLIEVDGGGWEIAEGSLSGSTLTRTTLKSSNSDSAVNLPSGTHTVSQILTAARVDAKAEAFSDLGIPENGYLVLATQSQSVADNNPTVGGVDVVWLIVDETSAPASPTGLTATGSDGEVSLSWTASSGADGHRVYRNTTNDFSTASQVGSDLGASANSYTDTGVTNGTEYWYWVTAFNSIGESSESTPDSATPSAGTSDFTTDFSEYTTGSTPSDMSTYGPGSATVETKSGAVGGVVLRLDLNDGNDGRTAAVWSDAADDVEILCAASTDQDTVGSTIRIIARAGADPTQDCYWANVNTSDGEIRIRKYTEGTIGTLDSASFTATSGTLYRLRFRLIGTTLKLKVWEDGTSEPTTGGPDNDGFQCKATDSDHSSGTYGVGAFSPGLHDFDWFSAAFNGGTAPEVT